VDVCGAYNLAGKTVWVCTFRGAQGGSKITVVEDYDDDASSKNTYESWGTYWYYELLPGGGTILRSESFCCQVQDDANTQHHVLVYGSDFGDDVRFHAPVSVTNLKPTGINPGGFTGTVYAYGGDDDIYGSNDNGLIEALHGGDDEDTIYGNAGSEYIYGDDGSDTLFAGTNGSIIYGGEGDDTINGGAGGDIIFGEGGVDTIIGKEGDDDIDGGDSIDRINGGDGNDEIYGGDGADVICGGDGDDDELYADDPDTETPFTDQLWDTSAAVIDCGVSTAGTNWGGASGAVSNCASGDEIATEPSACPGI